MLDKLLGLIFRAEVTATDDGKATPLVQIRAFGRTIWAEAVQPYGMATRVPAGRLAMALSVGSDSENIAALPVNGNKRPGPLKDGEAAFGNFENKTYVLFTEDGKMKFFSKGDLVWSSDASKTEVLKGDLAVTEDVAVTGKIDATGDIKSVAKVIGLTDVVFGARSTNLHTHTTGTPGNPTSPPV